MFLDEHLIAWKRSQQLAGNGAAFDGSLDTLQQWYVVWGVSTAYIMLLIAVSYRRCGRNLWAKLDTVINSLSANHAYLKTLYNTWRQTVSVAYSLHSHGHFSRWTLISQYQNVSSHDMIVLSEQSWSCQNTLQCFNTVGFGDRKGIWSVKSWVLVCWWWWFDWSFSRLIAPVAGPEAWNSLPVDIRSSDTVTAFMNSLKTYLFKLSYCIK